MYKFKDSVILCYVKI